MLSQHATIPVEQVSLVVRGLGLATTSVAMARMDANLNESMLRPRESRKRGGESVDLEWQNERR